MGLRAKFAAIFLLLLILPIAATALLEIDRTMAVMIDDLADSAALLIDLTSEQVRATSAPAGENTIVTLRQNSALASFIDAAQTLGRGVVYVRVEKLDGTVILGPRTGDPATTLTFYDLHRMSGGWLPTAGIRALWAVRTYDMSRVVEVNDKPFAIIAVGLSTSLVARRVHRAVTGMLVAAACASALSVLGAIFFAGLIMRPLTAITSGMEQIAVGNDQVSVRVAGSDELSVLAAKFNQLSQRVNLTSAQWEAERTQLLGLVCSIADAVLILDQAGAILFANEQAEGRLGLPAGGLANGKTLQHLLGEDNPLARIASIANATGSGVSDVPVEMSDRAGRAHFLVSLFPLDQQPAPRGLLVILRDLEPLRGLRTTRDEIGQLNEALEALHPSANAQEQHREPDHRDDSPVGSRKS